MSLQVSKVVTKVKQLVDVAKINSTLAFTVVTIISNVMTSSETALAASSEKYAAQTQTHTQTLAAGMTVRLVLWFILLSCFKQIVFSSEL